MYILDQIETNILTFINKQEVVTDDDLKNKFKGYFSLDNKLMLFQELELIELIDDQFELSEVKYKITEYGKGVVTKKKIDFLGNAEFILRIVVLLVVIGLIIVLFTL